MEAQFTMKATPSEFRLIREAVRFTAERYEADAKNPGTPAATRRECTKLAAELREIEGRL